MNKKITVSLLCAAIAFITISITHQQAFAQSSATVDLFETGNASDDTCSAITQTGSVVWLGCAASGTPTTLRINAMSGNTTLATTTLASQDMSSMLFFPATSGTAIILVDTSGAASDIVRTYTLSGSTISNTASLTLTNCGAGTRNYQQVSQALYIMCTGGTEVGKIKIVNMATLTLTDTLSTLIQGNCTTAQAFSMVSTTQGVVFCDNTEANLFTVSGTTITFSDELTGWASIVSYRNVRFTGQAEESFTVWTFRSSAGQNAEVATVDISTMTWDSSIVSLPSQAAVVGQRAASIYMFSIDSTDNNVLVYDWTETQPSVALANLSDASLDVTASAGFSIIDNELFIASSVTDVGRYYIISDIVIAGTPLVPSPSIPGLTPDLTDTVPTILCTMFGLQTILDCTPVDDDGDGEPDRWTVPGNLDSNGVGAIMLLVLILISYAFLVAIHSFARRPLTQIHPVLLVIVLIADVSIAWLLGFASDTIFYTMIAVMVGLTAFGLYRQFRGD